MFEFSQETLANAPFAHQWHCGFAASDSNITKVELQAFEALAASGKVFSAKKINAPAPPDFSCIVYYDALKGTWLLGGLMSSHEVRGKGVAEVVCCVALGNLIALDNPFGRGERIISYVAKENFRPVTLLKRTGFTQVREFASASLMSSDNARLIHEYELTDRRQALTMLSSWAGDWQVPLAVDCRIGARLRIPAGGDIKIWKRIFDAQLRYGS